MKSRFPILVFFFLTVPIIFGQPGAPKPVGRILHVQGKAYLQDRQKRITLHPGNHNIPLLATYEIGCISSCTITFTIGSRTFRKSTRYIIPNQIKRVSGETKFVVASGEKSGANMILFPIASEIGVVRPESFKFRWRVIRVNNRVVDIRPLTLSLRDCEGIERIWRKPGINYKSGSYAPEDILEKLKQHQLKDSKSKIEIVLESESFDENQRFCFSLISTDEEENLQRDLAHWHEYDHFVRLTERAYVFENYKLYQDAILEYEKALILFPRTDHLLAETIKAYLQIGDTDTAIQVLERLRRISPRNREYLRMKRMLRFLTLTRVSKRSAHNLTLENHANETHTFKDKKPVLARTFQFGLFRTRQFSASENTMWR